MIPYAHEGRDQKDCETMRTPLIAGNWKMNKTLADAREFTTDLLARIEGVSGVDVLLCTPFTLLFPMAKAVADSPLMLGAQNAHEEPHGAYTGETSVSMVKDTGCSHVIVGHSERRKFFNEDATTLARKVRAVVNAGMTAIYCVGETLEDRETGRTSVVIDRQMNEVINRDVDFTSIVIAYEPVWAIGTGKTATPDEAATVHAQIRNLLGATYSTEASKTVRILYGGSVNPGNAGDLFRDPNIDGGLVGGACLEVESFSAIIKAAATVGALCD